MDRPSILRGGMGDAGQARPAESEEKGMGRTLNHRVALICVAIVATLSGAALAGVGEPTGAGPGGTFSIRITQGGTVIVDNPNAPFPVNIKTNPLDAVQIGTTVAGTPIVLKVQSDFGAVEDFRITHWYISTPMSLAQVSTPSPNSLFDASNPNPITVEIGNVSFTGTPGAYPLVVNNNSFAVSYMIDSNGRYYQTPNTNPYNLFGQGKVDVQVPGQWYVDGSASPYQFSSTEGAVTSWKYQNILPPGVSTQVVQNNGSLGGTGFPSAGHVFELGLGVAFVQGAPEPATLVLLAGGGLLILRRRRYRHAA